MTKRKKPDPDMYSPASFVQLSKPILESMLETDVPSFVFQPMNVMALGQIQAASLINKRCLACRELHQRLAACRSPEDFMQENQRFFQTALRDYADALAAMTQAWDNAIAEQNEPHVKAKTDHDYLPLPGVEVNGQDIEEKEESAPKAPQKSARPEAVADRRSVAGRTGI